MTSDKFGRKFRNLRLSLTAACNYACTYCVPDGKKLMAANQELPSADMIRLLRLIVQETGIEKLRLTGGEPLLSPKLEPLLGALPNMDFDDISITTNGQFLSQKLEHIQKAGIKRLNISLDTLEAGKFRSISKSGDLKSVLAGIDLALKAGLKLKINMVPMRSINDDQILPLLAFCIDKDIELRFIELMNMGHYRGTTTYQQQFFPLSDILETIATRYNYTETNAPIDSTALRYKLHDTETCFGIIANESAPFCQSCTRLRLSSNGQLYGCLSNSKSYDLTTLLRLSESEAKEKLRSILGSALRDKQTYDFQGEVTVMKFIGG